jgi:hypothetical protein
MDCWKCGEKLTEITEQYRVQGSICKVPFRAMCEHCQAWLHCCRNCVHYKPGLPNDCEVPGTEFIPDREAANLCEDFLIQGKKVGSKTTREDVEKRLFGEEPKEQKKNPFDDLFR